MCCNGIFRGDDAPGIYKDASGDIVGEERFYHRGYSCCADPDAYERAAICLWGHKTGKYNDHKNGTGPAF